MSRDIAIYFWIGYSRRPNLLQARLGLEDAQPDIPSCPSYRHEEFPAHFDVFRDPVYSCENTGGMGAWLSLSLPGGHLILKATVNAGRSCDNNGRFRKTISSTREVLLGIAESA